MSASKLVAISWDFNPHRQGKLCKKKAGKPYCFELQGMISKFVPNVRLVGLGEYRSLNLSAEGHQNEENFAVF